MNQENQAVSYTKDKTIYTRIGISEYDSLKKIAKEKNITVSELIRIMLRQVLELNKGAIPLGFLDVKEKLDSMVNELEVIRENLKNKKTPKGKN